MSKLEQLLEHPAARREPTLAAGLASCPYLTIAQSLAMIEAVEMVYAKPNLRPNRSNP